MTPTLALPDPPVLRPYENGPYRMAMGLVTIAATEWLRIDRLYPEEMTQRRSLIAIKPEEVVLALPGTSEAQAELLEAVVGNLVQNQPDLFDRQDGSLVNRLTGEHWDIEGTASPLAVLGQLVQEDFCLLRVEDGAPRLVAGVLCFPNRWRLADKIGLPLAGVHVPVPLYGERLQRPVDRFLSLLQPGRIALRANWSLVDDPTLHQPTGHGRQDSSNMTAEDAGERLFLRVERQTFVRLPQTEAVVFGIRTYVTPLAVVLALPGEAMRLREAVLALPPEMMRYKSLLPFREVLLSYLAAREPGRLSEA